MFPEAAILLGSEIDSVLQTGDWVWFAARQLGAKSRDFKFGISNTTVLLAVHECIHAHKKLGELSLVDSDSTWREEHAYIGHSSGWAKFFELGSLNVGISARRFSFCRL